jgi:hypothetical protein
MIRPAALTLLMLVVSPCAAPLCLADEAPAVTSDTLTFCRDLAQKVADRHSPLPDVQRLLSEGRDMCERGMVRGGIRRIRRALVTLKHKMPKEEDARQ